MNKKLIIDRNSPLNDFGGRVKKSRYLLFMIIPAIIYYVVFCYVPMYGILIAFKEYYPNSGIVGSPWAGGDGFGNFRFIFESEEFWPVLRNTVLIGLGKIIISFISALLVALLINEIRLRFFKKTVQTIVTFPHFLSWVIVGGLVGNIFGMTGIINNTIAALGGERIRFMGNGSVFLSIIFGSDVWKEAGWSSIIYLATMAGISPELYEAAVCDGATRFQRLCHVTLPSILPTITVMLILRVGSVMDAGFDQVFNLYNSAVYKTGDIIDTYVYREGLGDMKYSFSTAVGLFKNLIGFVLVVGTNAITKKINGSGIW